MTAQQLTSVRLATRSTFRNELLSEYLAPSFPSSKSFDVCQRAGGQSEAGSGAFYFSQAARDSGLFDVSAQHRIFCEAKNAT